MNDWVKLAATMLTTIIVNAVLVTHWVTSLSGEVKLGSQATVNLVANVEKLERSMGEKIGDVKTQIDKLSPMGQKLTEHEFKIQNLEDDVRTLKEQASIIRSTPTTRVQ